ncbi:MAG: NUDIX domain-containing protein [Kineosporiaceae bacterium]|nr:NUDIX domain-containing protein [Kineosporiaceae bacterium]
MVAAAIVDDLARPRRLLAARRTEPDWAAGLWELPGGGVEPGEDHRAALHRELAEELGVGVRLGEELLAPGTPGEAGRGEVRGWPIRPGWAMRVWWAEIRRGEPAPIEDHDAVLWLDAGEWQGLDWLPSNLPVVDALVRGGR